MCCNAVKPIGQRDWVSVHRGQYIYPATAKYRVLDSIRFFATSCTADAGLVTWLGPLPPYRRGQVCEMDIYLLAGLYPHCAQAFAAAYERVRSLNRSPSVMADGHWLWTGYDPLGPLLLWNRSDLLRVMRLLGPMAERPQHIPGLIDVR